MLKRFPLLPPFTVATQPPSGGCVLKQGQDQQSYPLAASAAFGRLCVETMIDILMSINANQPPSGGCVLKQKVTIWVRSWF